ncbi:MAG: alpha/beta hydrolase [Dehalococcoidia bacterium]|nr:alpha/beta hydrolase [Dehalococcoidia bacterium]
MNYRFAGFELDTDAFDLRYDGHSVHVEPQVFELLAYIVENAHRVVPKAELVARIWPDGFISDTALSSRLASARRALGDSGHAQRFIKTIHGRGIRFVGQMETENATDGASLATTQPDQVVRFCRSRDGTHIAFASLGTGLPFVKAPNWITHLNLDLESPIWGHWLREIASRRQLIRHDTRGSGMSDWNPRELTFERMVEDLEAVVDTLDLSPFPLIGLSQGGPIAIEYALRHPEKVSRLILHGAYGRGWRHRSPDSREHGDIEFAMIRSGWGDPLSGFSVNFAADFVPGVQFERLEWLIELQRQSATPENAHRIFDAIGHIDILGRCAELRVPTLVLHAAGDRQVPYEEGVLLAATIPNATFVRLESANHITLEDEPAWGVWRRAFWEFVGQGETRG